MRWWERSWGRRVEAKGRVRLLSEGVEREGQGRGILSAGGRGVYKVYIR